MTSYIKRKKQKEKYFAAAIIVAGLLYFTFGYAEDSNSITQISEQQKNDKETQEKIDELKKRAEVYKEIIEIKKRQSDSIQNQLDLVNTDMQMVQTEIESNKRKIESLNKQIIELENKIQEKIKLIEKQKDMLAKLMETYYENSQHDSFSMLLMNENFASFVVKKDRMAQTGEKIKEIVDSLYENKKELESNQEELETKRGEIGAASENLKEKDSYLQNAKEQKRVLLAKTQGEQNKYEDLLKRTQEQIELEIQQIEQSKAGVDLGPLPPSSKLFIYPVNPVVITQSYGKTSFSNSYASGKHNGIDFGIKYANVYAVKEGSVLATGDNGKYAYGKWVAIDHGNGLVTLYGHFSKINVSKGKSVKQGDIIGISGNTGFSTGPHLHFTVFAKKTFELVESSTVAGLILPTGVSVDPAGYL